jgi:carboxymethylenebutenolidase
MAPNLLWNERMIEHHIDIRTSDGLMNTFVVHPQDKGPHPLVLFYMDAPGKREELHDMARRLASVGYVVMLPNLYYRRSRDYYLKERTPEAMVEMFGHMHSLNAQTTQTDTASLLSYADQLPAVNRHKVGMVGYCMSGPFVMWAAAHFPDRLSSIASIHGANMVTDQADSPHLMAPQIRCESYFACAEIDKWAPPEHIEQLKAALDDAGTRYALEWYPQAHHGFVFPQRAGMYHQPSAERHWERLFDLFDRTLRR